MHCSNAWGILQPSTGEETWKNLKVGCRTEQEAKSLPMFFLHPLGRKDVYHDDTRPCWKGPKRRLPQLRFGRGRPPAQHPPKSSSMRVAFFESPFQWQLWPPCPGRLVEMPWYVAPLVYPSPSRQGIATPTCDLVATHSQPRRSSQRSLCSRLEDDEKWPTDRSDNTCHQFRVGHNPSQSHNKASVVHHGTQLKTWQTSLHYPKLHMRTASMDPPPGTRAKPIIVPAKKNQICPSTRAAGGGTIVK